jgi:hypothetical protein
MAKKDKQYVRSHLQAIIYLKTGAAEATAQPIGHARLQSFSADHDYGTQPVHGLGDYLPAEHVHLKFSGTIQLEAFMIRKADLVALGLAPLGDTILQSGTLEISIQDPDNGGKVLRSYEGVTIQRYSENVREGQICGENATCFFREVKHDTDFYSGYASAPSPIETTPTAVEPVKPGETTADPTTSPAAGSPPGN